MSAPQQESLPLFCELGWHRPEKLARWNDGYYFSKCTRCGRDIVRTAYGHWQEPRGYRVVWQASPPESRPDIDLVPVQPGEAPTAERANGAAGASPRQDDGGTRTLEPEGAGASGTSGDGDRQEAPFAADWSQAAEAASRLENAPAALPMVGLLSHTLPAADDRPPNGRSPATAAMPAGLEIGRVPEAAAGAATPATPGSTSSDAGQADLSAAAAEESHPHDDQLSFSDVPSPEAATARPDELPILQVIRHLKATAPALLPEGEEAIVHAEADVRVEIDRSAQPVPPAVSEAGKHSEALEDDTPAQAFTDLPSIGSGPDTEAVSLPGPLLDDAEPEQADVAEPSPGDAQPEQAEVAEPSPGDDVEPEQVILAGPSSDDAAPAADLAAPTVADPEPEQLAPQEPSAADPEPEQTELAAAEPRKEPVRHYSDFDFMAEEEEDPIGTFWEQTPAGEARPAAATQSAPEPSNQHQAAHAPAQAAGSGASRAPLSSGWAAPLAAGALEPSEEAERVEAVQQRTDARRESRTDEAFEPGGTESTNAVVRVAAAEAPAAAMAATASAAASAPAAETGPVASLEEWLQRSEQQPGAAAGGFASDRPGEHGEAGLPAPRMALAALVSVGIVALVIALSARSNVSTDISNPSAEQPAAASGPGDPVNTPPATDPDQRVLDVAPEESTADRAAGSNAAAGALSPPLDPILPARETAFVTASVLQCRSAPVEGSAPVRKLVRGTEVQILGREGNWTSVAHKGRQCWASTRFLSALPPW